MMVNCKGQSLKVILCCALILIGIALVCSACGGTQEIAFAVKHLRDDTGEQLTEVVSYAEYPQLDNSAGTAALQVQIEFERNYYYKIITRLNTNEVPAQRVQQKIVELYKLPPNAPEETLQTALCPMSVVIPAGQKAIITAEWTERWAEGVINKGEKGEGDQLGTFRVFLGYIEPCSLIEQENVD